jgi:hypothetical protein
VGEIAAGKGIITTVAGNGAQGNAGDTLKETVTELDEEWRLFDVPIIDSKRPPRVL